MESGGHLPPGWTPETLKKTHESKPRNPSIAKAFFWIRYAEEVGIGTNKIVQWCKEWGLPEPEFQYKATSIVVTFKNPPTVAFKEGSQTGSQTSSQRIVEMMRHNSAITIGELAEDLKISPRAVKKHIKILRDKKLIKRVGPDFGGKWEVCK